LKRIITNTISILQPAERRQLAIQVALDIVISILDILFLALLLFIIHFYTQPAGETVAYLPAWLTHNHSLWLITIFFLLFSLKNIAGFLVYRAQCRFVCQVATRIAENKLINYQQGEYDAYINTDSAAHIRRIGYQPIDFCQHVLGGIQQIITQAALIVLTIVAMLIFNANMFLLLFVILLPPVVLVFYIVKNRLHTARSNAQSNIERSLQYLHEALSGFVESNIYQKNKFFLQRYITYQRQFNKYLANVVIVQGIPARMMEIFALMGLFILIAINQWSNGSGAAIITVGAFMAAAYKIIPGMVKILNTIGQIRNYEFTIADIIATGASAYTVPTTAARNIHSVSVEQVHFSYADATVLNGISFSVQQGDFLGIAGQSGKGKTTILHLLLGFLTPAAGNLRFNATDTDAALRRQYWKHIAYVKQQSFLIHDTLLRNIVLDESPPDEKKLREVAAAAGLTELVDSFPEKWQKVIAENGKNISGGQRQRIAIARALYKESDLIVLDEPFNELDEASETRLLHHFKQLSQAGKMVILITHNKSSLSFCNKIVSLDEAAS
jgi:ABC-type multidrug transport system fused ATPase/permease subunit